MIWPDFVIIGIIALSMLISLVRGFVREALSLMAWVLAAWIALRFSADLAAQLSSVISVDALRLAAAFFILFVGTLIVAGFLNRLAGKLVRSVGLTTLDRLIGALFGIARGGVVVVILVLLLGMTSIVDEPWWGQSPLLDYAVELGEWLRQVVPSEPQQQLVNF
ncbi:MAG: CvpA family protein [Gammaproteobacteria bacterium]|nr:CvpA family protein [Gammaproteobacteria bacterium]